MRIFFYICASPDPSRWPECAARCRSNDSMRARALNKKKLLATLTPHLPVEYQSADKKEQLEKNLVR
jgi:hypothetical protein